MWVEMGGILWFSQAAKFAAPRCVPRYTEPAGHAAQRVRHKARERELQGPFHGESRGVLHRETVPFQFADVAPLAFTAENKRDPLDGCNPAQHIECGLSDRSLTSAGLGVSQHANAALDITAPQRGVIASSLCHPDDTRKHSAGTADGCAGVKLVRRARLVRASCSAHGLGLSYVRHAARLHLQGHGGRHPSKRRDTERRTEARVFLGRQAAALARLLVAFDLNERVCVPRAIASPFRPTVEIRQ